MIYILKTSVLQKKSSIPFPPHFFFQYFKRTTEKKKMNKLFATFAQAKEYEQCHTLVKEAFVQDQVTNWETLCEKCFDYKEYNACDFTQHVATGLDSSPLCAVCDNVINPSSASLWNPLAPVPESRIKYPCYVNNQSTYISYVCEFCFKNNLKP
jgi:hypothetical protein